MSWWEKKPPAHKSVVVMAVMHDCGFELIDNFPYSPNLSPSDYFLFPNMKNLAGKQYQTNDEVICAIEDFLKIRMRPIPNPSTAALIEEVCGP